MSGDAEIFTFQYGSTFNFLLCMCFVSLSKFLYIPIWFYFNPNAIMHPSRIFIFTFQYGSTFKFNAQIGRNKSNYFTFQYGSTFNSDPGRSRRQHNRLYIPIWFYFNSIAGNAEGSIVTFTFQYGSTLMEHKRNKKNKRNNFTFQYGSTLIYSCQFRIFFMLICSFLSTSLYLFYFPIHFIMFFIKKPLIPFIYIPLSTSSHFLFYRTSTEFFHY